MGYGNMKGIIVKYFKTWNEVRDIVKNSKYEKDITTPIRSHTYKVYFDPWKRPIQVKGFDGKGENTYTCYPYGYPYLTTDSEPVLRDIYIYRQKNESDALEKGNRYHFILCNEEGQELEHEIW